MTDDGKPGVAEALDEALMETHHLANISGLDEARLARRRLVEAQSATSVHRTRDRLEQAIEYLELARLERRDTAAGFVQARELVAYAEAGLRAERPAPLDRSPLDLLRRTSEPESRETLAELRADAAVGSFEQLRHDVQLEDTFRELQRQVNDGEFDHEPADDGDLDPEAALSLASLEMDIERSLQDAGDDSEFEFVEDGELADPEGDGETDHCGGEGAPSRDDEESTAREEGESTTREDGDTVATPEES